MPAIEYLRPTHRRNVADPRPHGLPGMASGKPSLEAPVKASCETSPETLDDAADRTEHDLAILRQPGNDDSPAAQVLFCGGFHSSMRGNKASDIAAHCERRGVAFTRFDYRGHGESGGNADTLTLHDWLDDALCVVDSLDAARPLVVVGSSMGAWIAVHVAARRVGSVAGLLLVASAPDFLQDRLETMLDAGSRRRLAREGITRLPGTAKPASDRPDWPVTLPLIESGRALAVLTGDVPCSVRCPVRMLHGSADATAPWQSAATLLSRFGSEDAELALIKGGDHRLSGERDLERQRKTLDALLALACPAGPES